jgi:hypothetical protein
MDKLYGNVLGVCTAPASAKGNEFPAPVEPLRHVVAGSSQGVSLIHEAQTCCTPSLQCVSRYLRERGRLLSCARTVHGALSSREWAPGGRR